MLDSKARDALRGISDVIGRTLGRVGITPNLVTVTGVLVTAVASVLVVSGRPVAAGLTLIGGGLLDFVDGSIARATGQTTVFGGFLDSVSDRLSDGLILASLVWSLHAVDDVRGAELALAAMLLSSSISYVRAKAEALGFDCKVGVVERAERIIAIIIGLLFGIMTPVLALLVVGSVVTLVQRLVHVRRQAVAD